MWDVTLGVTVGEGEGIGGLGGWNGGISGKGTRGNRIRASVINACLMLVY